MPVAQRIEHWPPTPCAMVRFHSGTPYWCNEKDVHHLKPVSTGFFAALTAKNQVETTAVGFEILNNSVQDVKQFAMDVIESEEKEYLKLLVEYNRSNT